MMSLIGWQFPALIGVVALAAMVGLVWGWRRLSRNRPHLIAGRIGAVLGINVLVVFLAGVLLNQQFLFYASWTDLANSFSQAPKQSAIARGTKAERAASINLKPGQGRTITTRPPLRYPALPAGTDGGRRLTFTVHGRASGITSTVVVQLPADYRSPAAADNRYPVLETFQGYPGQPLQWLNVLRLGDAVDADAAGHTLQAPIIVSPQTEVPVGVDSECVNGGGQNPAVETWLTTDVPNWVVTHFRVKTDRQAWATIGLSAGGWCAAMATMHHPGTYAAAIVMAGYFKPWFGPYYRPFEPKSQAERGYDLLSQEVHSPPPVAIWLETSHADRDSYPTTATFLKDVHNPTSVTATVLANAGHRMSVWISMLPGALNWLGSNVPGFRAAA